MMGHAFLWRLLAKIQGIIFTFNHKQAEKKIDIKYQRHEYF